MKSKNEYISKIIILTNGCYYEYPFIISEIQKDNKLKILFLFSFYQNYFIFEGEVII
jgi:hypothetical protein